MTRLASASSIACILSGVMTISMVPSLSTSTPKGPFINWFTRPSWLVSSPIVKLALSLMSAVPMFARPGNNCVELEEKREGTCSAAISDRPRAPGELAPTCAGGPANVGPANVCPVTIGPSGTYSTAVADPGILAHVGRRPMSDRRACECGGVGLYKLSGASAAVW